MKIITNTNELKGNGYLIQIRSNKKSGNELFNTKYNNGIRFNVMSFDDRGCQTGLAHDFFKTYEEAVQYIEQKLEEYKNIIPIIEVEDAIVSRGF